MKWPILLSTVLCVAATDVCEPLKTSADCKAKGCVWCESAAVPSACYTKDDAKGLPPTVFDCDKPTELWSQQAARKLKEGREEVKARGREAQKTSEKIKDKMPTKPTKVMEKAAAVAAGMQKAFAKATRDAGEKFHYVASKALSKKDRVKGMKQMKHKVDEELNAQMKKAAPEERARVGEKEAKGHDKLPKALNKTDAKSKGKPPKNPVTDFDKPVKEVLPGDKKVYAAGKKEMHRYKAEKVRQAKQDQFERGVRQEEQPKGEQMRIVKEGRMGMSGVHRRMIIPATSENAEFEDSPRKPTKQRKGFHADPELIFA